MGSDPAAARWSWIDVVPRGLTPAKRGQFVDERHQRLRGEVRHRQRLGLGERQRHFRQDAVPHGHPGQPEEHLPLQHPGPADLVRGAGVGGGLSRAPRRHRPDGGDEPADLQGGPGRDRARRLAALRFDAAAHLAARRHHRAGRADRRDVRRQVERHAPAPAVQEHGLRRRADGAARHRPRGAARARSPTSSRARRSSSPPTWRRWRWGATTPPSISIARCRSSVRHAEGAKGKILVSGNDAAGLGAIYAGATVCAWYPITPSTSLAEAFEKYARRLRIDQGRPAALRHRAGGGRAGRHRRRHRRRLERRALLHRHLRPRHLADERVPGACLLRRGAGGAVQHPARRPLDRHADAHAAVRHHLLRLRLARRHQARAAVPEGPHRVLLDGRAGLRPRRAAADAGHRHVRPRHRHERLGDRRRSPGTTRTCTTAARCWTPRRSTSSRSIKGRDWGRYQDIDGDAIPYRTLPGTHPTKGAFFTRGTSHDENARYTEDGRIHARVLDRIRRKFDTAATLVPKPEITIRDKSGKTGLIYFGANTPAVHEALDLLERDGLKVNALRIKAFPFTREVASLLRHARARVRGRAEPRRADALAADDRSQRAGRRS